MVMRGAKRKGVRYFGPFAHAYAIRETLDLLLRTFPIRTCTNDKFDRHQRLGRPCLYAHIEKCAAPCVGDISHERLRRARRRAARRSSTASTRRSSTGSRSRCTRRRTRWSSSGRPACATSSLSVRKAIERQQMVGDEGGGLRRHRPRRGRRSRRRCRSSTSAGAAWSAARGSSSTRSRTSTPPALVGPHPRAALRRRAGRGRAQGGARPGRARGRRALRGVPVATLRGSQGADPGAAAGRRSASCSRRSPQNARGGVHPAQAQAGVRPQRPGPGAHRAAGRARPARGAAADRVLRHLQPPGHRDRRLDGGDGGRAAEAVRLPAVQGPSPGRPGRLRRDGGGAHPPLPPLPRGARRGRAGRASGSPTRRTCCSIDGGKGQLGVAVRVLEELGLEDIAVASLAKRFEEVYRPGRADPVRIPRDSEALYLLQQVRDEAHRFAITYHRQLRGKAMTRRSSTTSPGSARPGATRLLKEFGSVKRLRAHDRGRARRARRGCPTRSPAPSTTVCTASPTAAPAPVTVRRMDGR